MNTTDLKKLNYNAELNLDRGLRARKQKDGSVSFILMKKQKGQGRGSPLRLKLGSWPEMSIDDAEEKARLYRGLINQGVHPSDYERELLETREQEKLESEAQAVTLLQLLEKYERSREVYDTGNAPRTMKDRRYAITSVYEEWLALPIQQITKQMVEDKIHEWGSQRGSKGQAQKASRYLRSLLNYAKTMDYIQSNPCDILKGKISLSSKEVKDYLELDECEELVDWIDRLTHPRINLQFLAPPYNFNSYEIGSVRQMMFDAIALQLLTGLRKREVLFLRWEQVFLTEDQWEGAKGPYFQFLKSKQQEAMGVPITPQMEPVFKRLLNNSNSNFLFPSPRAGAKPDAPIDNERGAMRTLNKLMPNLRSAPKIASNVLRKTFATTAYSLGYSMEEIGLVTGHTSAITNTKVATKAYVNRQADSHRERFNVINDALTGAMTLELQPIPASNKDIKELINA
jgi:integrase